jgi:hypothetical protein
MISNIEAGRVGISEERLRRLVSIYGCQDVALTDALALRTGGRQSGWWDEYRGKIPSGFLDVSELEYYAVRLRTAQTIHLPGLLQTEDHAREIFGLVVPKLPRLELELRVAHRLARQTVFERTAPLPYTGILHEAGLRMRFGGTKVARAQLEFLVEASERDNITLLVVPYSAGSFPGAGQSILYAEGEVPQLDTVQLDSSFGAAFVESPTPLANYRGLLDLMEDSALSPGESQDLIRSIARDL